MAVREIIRASIAVLEGIEKSILRESFHQVENFDESLSSVVSDLLDTFHSDDLSVGLAAPQIGIPLAIVVVNLRKKENKDLVLVNPRVIDASGQEEAKFESCMSIPHKRGMVPRRPEVEVDYQEITGQVASIVAKGFLARVLQHEIDHVNGILFTDYMSDLALLEETDIFRKHGII